MNLSKKAISVSALVLTGAMAFPMYAQQDATAAPAAASTDSATGKPLELQSKEGFWGHMNPFARKKWVHRQIDPVKDRVNELDEVQAKNSRDIKDVDARATAGINRAQTTADSANNTATDAGNRANAANGVATTASTRTEALHGTISNIDQYSAVTSKNLPFVAGRTTLTVKQKKQLDDVADQLAAQKGYIVEVQGYSRGGVSSSQAMADSVVRYLVAEHQVPIYRIYRQGLGHTKSAAEEGEKPLTNGVRVAVLQNSLATMDNGATQGSTAAPASSTQTPSSNSTPTTF